VVGHANSTRGGDDGSEFNLGHKFTFWGQQKEGLWTKEVLLRGGVALPTWLFIENRVGLHEVVLNTLGNTKPGRFLILKSPMKNHHRHQKK